MAILSLQVLIYPCCELQSEVPGGSSRPAFVPVQVLLLEAGDSVGRSPTLVPLEGSMRGVQRLPFFIKHAI